MSDESILIELRRIRIALERIAPGRWQKVPQAATTLDVSPATLRRLIEQNKIRVRVLTKTKLRKSMEVDTIHAREFFETGGLLKNH